jgi:hypothetical protein
MCPLHSSGASHGLRSLPNRNRADGVDDADIARAPTEVAGEFLADARVLDLAQPHDHVARGDQHAGRAIATLQSVMGRERLAQFRHQRIVVEALDGADVAAVAIHRKCDAGALRDAVDVDRARAADTLLAAEMRPRQIKLLAQEIGQMGARLDQRLDRTAVHRDRDRRHASCRSARRTATVCN